MPNKSSIILLTLHSPRRSNRNPISTPPMAKDQTSPTTPSATTSACVPYPSLPLRSCPQLMRFVRQDYNEVFKQLRQSSIGDIVALNKISGPTICCNWVRQLDVRRRIQLMYRETGSRDAFATELAEYFQAIPQVHQVRSALGPCPVLLLILGSSLQHYPANNCGLGAPPPVLSDYVNHANGRQILRTQILQFSFV